MWVGGGLLDGWGWCGWVEGGGTQQRKMEDSAWATHGLWAHVVPAHVLSGGVGDFPTSSVAVFICMQAFADIQSDLAAGMHQTWAT